METANNKIRNGKIIYYYGDGKTISEISHYKDGKAHGRHTTYYPHESGYDEMEYFIASDDWHFEGKYLGEGNEGKNAFSILCNKITKYFGNFGDTTVKMSFEETANLIQFLQNLKTHIETIGSNKVKNFEGRELFILTRLPNGNLFEVYKIKNTFYIFNSGKYTLLTSKNIPLV